MPRNPLTGAQRDAAGWSLSAISRAFRDTYSNHRRNSFIDAVRALMVELGKRAGVQACRFCGCTETSACEVMGGGCSWVDESTCSALSCLAAAQQEVKARRA